MKFRKFKQNKLWRDKAVERMEQMGSKIHWRELDSDEFLKHLKIKLLEEANEVCSAATKESVMEEIADVLEVVSSLCDFYESYFEDVIKLQRKKREERGGFQGRKFVTVAEHLVGSFGEKYCLADPDKYPEICTEQDLNL